MLKACLEQLLARRDLDRAEAAELIDRLTGGDADPALAGAVLAALRMKGENVSELAGGADFLRRHAVFVDCGGRDCVDIVGTGGDGGKTFNISTTAAFVAAGAGAAVAKHGSGAVSGKSGAADLLAALGFNLDAAPETMEECIALHGIGFLYARKLHPAMGRAAALRRALGIRTIFNLLGPLANPAGVRKMVVGVCAPELTELFAEVLRELGVRRALVVHGHDGLDEISCCDATRVTELENGNIRTGELYPELLVGSRFDPAEIAGGTPSENAAITRGVLAGNLRGAPRAVTVLNAAAACLAAGIAPDLRTGVALAEQAIDSGRALEKMETLIRESQR